MPVPFLDLQAQYRPLRDDIQRAMQEVLDTSSYILGPSVVRFEQAFASFCATKHTVGLNTGTSALHLALLAVGVKPGDEVIVPAMTFIATASAVDYTGARTVLVDVDPVTCTLDPAKIEAAITPRTKVILPVHLYGQSADMDPILEIAKRHNLIVIEDAAQAHAAEYKGRRCGSMGALGAFSFYPGKNLGAYGEGGALVTSNDEYARLVRMYRDWGAEKRYHHVLKGYNFRMDGLQGAVLGVKLQHLEEWTEGRRRAAALYLQKLAGVPGVLLPSERPGNRHVWHVFGIRVKNRDAVLQKLGARGIGCGIHYPVPVHLQACFAEWGHKPGDFPISEAIAAEEVSLPMYAELTEVQIDEVCAAVKEAV